MKKKNFVEEAEEGDDLDLSNANSDNESDSYGEDCLSDYSEDESGSSASDSSSSDEESSGSEDEDAEEYAIKLTGKKIASEVHSLLRSIEPKKNAPKRIRQPLIDTTNRPGNTTKNRSKKDDDIIDLADSEDEVTVTKEKRKPAITKKRLRRRNEVISEPSSEGNSCQQ